ncbi:Hypothetical protein NTJ_06999 [Nesidiocoris tenuis]|uniref:Uncharacterized protein n=1 Tax=Nesidiocoris tenuis TaxID=355587 RepID=A0ABN7APP6_9HEMI|nr:Hypothetical protein NTJ_06999 [Nesidiocoris tenuis]
MKSETRPPSGRASKREGRPSGGGEPSGAENGRAPAVGNSSPAASQWRPVCYCAAFGLGCNPRSADFAPRFPTLTVPCRLLTTVAGRTLPFPSADAAKFEPSGPGRLISAAPAAFGLLHGKILILSVFVR